MARLSKYDIIRACSREPFRRFDSLADFIAWREPLGDYPVSDDWAGGTFADALAKCRGGDLASVPAAEKYADLLNDAVDIAGRVDSWRLDVSGAFCCVPEYLAGSPECMYQMTAEQSTAAPLDVVFDISCNNKITAANMRRRGVCVLAALLALSRVRPVNAWVYTSCYVERPLVRLSSPLDVSEVCAVVTCPHVSRRLFVGCAWHEWKRRRHPKTLRCIPFADWGYSENSIKQALVELGGLGGDCLVLAGRVGDWSGMTDNQFVEELNGMIDNARAGV